VRPRRRAVLPDFRARGPAGPLRRRTSGGSEFSRARPVYLMFVSFGGIDYDNDDDAPDQLDEPSARRSASCGAAGTCSRSPPVAVAPTASSAPYSPTRDDAERTCSAALEDTRGLDGAREIGSGSRTDACAAEPGHARRRTFGCLGDAVNLARADVEAPGPDLSPSRSAAPRRWFLWTRALHPKGKAVPVEAHALTGSPAAPARRDTT
jgi:hypothetical protein